MATPFLYVTGTNGFTSTPFNLLTTELNALTSGNTALSSVGGTSGVFNQTNTGAAIWSYISFLAGGAVTPTAPQFIAGWFVLLADGTNYELTASNATQARAPDFTIPLLGQAHALNNVAAAQGLVRLPPVPFKTLIWSQVGASLPATGNKIICGPVEIQY